jgi:signal transduction histidine kinase
LVSAGLASWLLARRSLSPIGDIVRQARELTAARLDRRIEARPARDEVTEMVAVVNEMLDRLEAAFRSRERFIADVSHELKTPLSVLLSQVQVLLQQPRPTKDYQRFVSSVQDELRQLARLVDSLLILSRAESGAPLRPMPVSINDVVTDAAKACEPLAEERQVRLIPHLALPEAEGPEPVVPGDPTLLRSMMENLLRNAIRHSPMQAAVDVHAEVDGHQICVAVRDRGPGIPTEHLEHVFNRFYRIQRDGGEPQGAGLGLAIAKEVTRLHKGTIEAKNQPEGGCELSIRLPLQRVAEASARKTDL